MSNDKAVSTPVTNIFVLMLENHSFDNMFAMSGIEGIRAATVSDSNSHDGVTYNVRKGAPSSMTTDPGHEFPDVLEQLCGTEAAAEYVWKYKKDSDHFRGSACSAYPEINLSGFATDYATSRSEETGQPAAEHVGDIMACFDTPTQLPVIYQLATEFAICDAWYASMPGPTWPNRFFVHGASSSGMDRSPNFKEEAEWLTVDGFTYSNGSIFQALDKLDPEKRLWRLYQDKENAFTDQPSHRIQGGWISQVASLKGVSLLDVHSLSRFKDDLYEENGAHYRDNHPYTFIEPNFGASFFAWQNEQEHGPNYRGGSSQHPEDNPYGGEALIKFVYETIFNSPLCDTSLLIIVYDEHGGFYDSEPPVCAVPPGDAEPCETNPLNSNSFKFDRSGVRVPAVIVSPLIPKGTVDHTVYDHSSILATLERKLGMDALTARDRNANDLWHLLSNAEPRQDIPKTLNSPAAIPTPPPIPIDGLDNKNLPESGNMIGFLQVLLKAEIELAERDRAKILADFGQIVTHSHAVKYVEKMWGKVEAAMKDR